MVCGVWIQLLLFISEGGYCWPGVYLPPESSVRNLFHRKKPRAPSSTSPTAVAPTAIPATAPVDSPLLESDASVVSAALAADEAACFVVVAVALAELVEAESMVTLK